MEKWKSLLVSYRRSSWFLGLWGSQGGGFDSGVFLSESSLGIRAGKVFRL